MTDQRPITPPPELVEQWYDTIDNSSTSWKQELATQAARWGADQELDACCEWIDPNSVMAGELRAARRPKPPSRPWMRRGISRRALAVLDEVSSRLDAAHENILRRALEQLDD